MTLFHYRMIFGLAFIISCFGFFSEVKQGPVLFSHFDKVMHFGVFAVLTLLLQKGFGLNWKIGLALAVIYGAAVEIIQGAFAGRQASFGDWVADILGAIAALYVLYVLKRRQVEQ